MRLSSVPINGNCICGAERDGVLDVEGATGAFLASDGADGGDEAFVV